MQIDDHIRDSSLGQVLSHIADQRFAEHWQRGFCAVGSQRPKPLSVTRRQNHSLHRQYILTEVFGVPTSVGHCLRRKAPTKAGTPNLPVVSASLDVVS